MTILLPEQWMSRFMQNSQVTQCLQQNNECQCAPDAQLTSDNHATRLDEAKVVEPAHVEQVPM